MEFVKRNVDVGTHTPLLAGNSVYVDFQFLKVYLTHNIVIYNLFLIYRMHGYLEKS